jgi:hypothetical protein
VIAALAEPPLIVSEELGYSLQSVAVALKTVTVLPASATGSLTPVVFADTVLTTEIVSAN